MRFLPLLFSAPKAAALPMADACAECLFRLVLTKSAQKPEPVPPVSHPAQGAEATGALASRMRADPPLVLWTACHAWRQDRLRPRSIEELADWLGNRVFAVLPWNSDSDYAAEPPAGVAERFGKQIEADLQTAELSTLLSGSSACPPDEVFLHGLLSAAEAWLTLAAHGSQGPPLDWLPEWLAQPDREPRHWVSMGAAMARGELPPPSEVDLEAIRHRCEQQRRGWFQSGPPLLDLLPELVAKMARLEGLEHEFQHAVETEKLEAMAEFAAGAGHEINNPLAIIGGRAQLLLAEEADPERRRELAVINAQVKRAHEMIADMRLFARPPQPEYQRFDLAQLIDELAAEVALQAAERRINVARSGTPGPVEVEADPAQLAVALRAMCKNSLELVTYDGHIGINLRVADDAIEIRVSDDGPGMQPEHRRHLFDPFYSARQAGRGLGLGLSKCWRIIALHGGRIDVESGPNQGATFTIRLPRRS